MTSPRANTANRHRAAPVQTADVAYVVLAHAAGEQLLRLLRTLREGSPKAAIVLHFDAKHEPPAPRDLQHIGVLMVKPRITVNWGDASQIDAMLAAIEFTAANVDFRWLTLISGQDYPLRPLSKIESDLRSADCDAFIRAGAAGIYAYRYELQYWHLPRFRRSHLIPERVRAWLDGLRNQSHATQDLFRIEPSPRGLPSRLGIRLPGAPFGDDFVCFKGSQWMTLNQRAVSHLLQSIRSCPAVLRHYRRTLVPDESCLQTIMCNDRRLRVRDDHRRFMVWSNPSSAHPATLTLGELEAMTASGKDFGRKFDMTVDAQVLDALDRRLSRKPETVSLAPTRDDLAP
jgi:Core-2/I-Branching enzyme